MGFFKWPISGVASRDIEKVGDWLESETVQAWGWNIQDACRETSARAGQSASYDRDTVKEQELTEALHAVGDAAEQTRIEARAKQINVCCGLVEELLQGV